uniref:MarR family transcriptional regulator n=1 Tax=Acidobacterium capsulatum TaxID=33075 RepID=A0A7V4XTU9_9BACT
MQTSSALETIAMADQLRALCSIITKVARADLESRLKDHNCGISAIEHGVLRHLSHGVTSMAEISRLMGVAPSTLVYVVDSLSERKLVARVKDPHDRRREPLQLKKRGAELFARFPKMDASSILVQGLERMTPSRRHELLVLLNELVKELTGSDRQYLSAEAEESASSSASRGRKAQFRGKDKETKA